MGQSNRTLLIFLISLSISPAFCDYPKKNPVMIQLISPPYSRLGEANNSPCLEFFEPTPLLLVDGKGDEGAGLGFPEQPLLPWMAIAAGRGSLGSGGNGWRGRSGDRNLDPKKVLHGLMILLFLLNMVRARGLGQSTKKTSDVYPWESMSSYLLNISIDTPC